jgi:hypothetical protein
VSVDACPSSWWMILLQRRTSVQVGRVALLLAALSLLLAACGATSITVGSFGQDGTARKVQPAPNGDFVTIGGQQESVAALRGHPVLLWFIAGGCASCAASIPTVGGHLHQLSASGIRVVTLGLPGDFGSGPQALSNLKQFGQIAAGPAFDDPDWTWGLATESMAEAYDPSGTPDVYFLITPSGRIWYRNSVPVSTINDLLAEARAMPMISTDGR